MVLLLNQGRIVGVCHISIVNESGIYGIVIDKKYRGTWSRSYII